MIKIEIIELNKVLAKALDIVDIGTEQGYFDETKKSELTNKLLTMFNNGIVYDLPGTAVYAMYSPGEQKLYFNTKVYKNEEEALVYVLHEIKHGLDHFDELIGFEYQNKGVGTNEGATQRFATDMAERMLHIKIPKKIKSSLGIRLYTHLDEYQIEDKLNELFCITMGISMEDFIQMQNDPEKVEFNKLISKFNQCASYETFKCALDEIYLLQEETWVDENHNMLDREKKPTAEQTKRAMALISICKKELLKYAKRENLLAIDRIKEEYFMTVDECGHIIRDDFRDDYDEENDIMTNGNIVMQADYIEYSKKILSQIGSEVLNKECSIIFITEFRYDNEDKVIYFRKGGSYQKVIVPVKDDMTLDIASITIQKVDDVSEIKESIEDCRAEFGIIANAPEYAKILCLLGEDSEAQIIQKKWDYYLSKQSELSQIRELVAEDDRILREAREKIRSSLVGEDVSVSQQSYFDNLLKKEIKFGNISVEEDGIFITNPDGTGTIASSEEEQSYISQIRSAFENGEISLTRVQLGMLDSYTSKNSPKKR